MTPNQLAKILSQKEGLKKQVDIAQIKELIGHLADMCFAEFQSGVNQLAVWDCLYTLGEKRAKKKKPKA
jgi:hypothetical protein